jgi:hypothetical protein
MIYKAHEAEAIIAICHPEEERREKSYGSHHLHSTDYPLHDATRLGDHEKTIHCLGEVL